MPGDRLPTEMDRRAALRLLGAGALGWFSTRSLACGGEPSLGAEQTYVALDEGEPLPGAKGTQVPASAGADAAGGGPNGNDVSDGGADASIADAQADAPEAGPTQYVTLYDTYAVALYFDGSLGPTTGIISVADVAAGVNKDYDFWHGHSGMLHRYALSAADFAKLKKKQKVETMTSVVENHQHKLFVDPTDPKWRVPGSKPVQVSV